MKSSRRQREDAVGAVVGSENGRSKNDIDWVMRPCGMLVQRREEDGDAGASSNGIDDCGPTIKINVSWGSSLHEFFVPSHITFGEMKHMLAPKFGLDSANQRLVFRGKDQEDSEHLHIAGVKYNSKVVLLEDPTSKEKKIEQKDCEGDSKASEAIAGVRAEVDKLSEKVAALEVAVHYGTKVEEKEFVVSTELLMRQLLKLDGIEAQGEARVQRKAEVHRVQGYVDKLDGLKVRNSNPFSNRSNSVSVTTNWETFESGVGSLTAPPPMSTSAKVTHDWVQFD